MHEGRVPERVADLMHAPHQEGDFPGPVKYGYLNVGVVEQGPEEWLGKTVFALHPHQDYFVLPASQPLPSRRMSRHGVLY